jgi:putative ABC transport system permease protein
VLVSDYLLSSIGSLTKQEQTGVSATTLFYFLGGIVLIAACLNYANLATAQASTRAKDIGMRRVVGARRSQIMFQFLIEAALVSTSALILAFATVLATILAFGIDGAGSMLISVIATGKFWLMLASLLTVVSLCAGVYPAFVLSQVRPTQAMRTAATRSGGQLTQRVLVATQFAAAAFLLVTVLSMNAQNGAFKELALSETADPFVLVSNNIRAAKVDYEVLRTELLRQPHIQSVTASALSPWVMVAGSYSVGQSPQMKATRVRTVRNAIQQDFFSTFGVDILAGRVFDRKYADVETGPTSISNVVIDRALAEQNGWTTPTEAIGKTLYDFVDPTKAPIPRRVIGVVGNRAMSIITVGPRSNMYVLAPDFATQPIVRISKSDRAAALKEIEQVWNKLAPNVALKMRFADQVVATAFQYFNVVWSVFSGVASLAFSMSILGLIGLSLHVIGRRKHEIGVRKTLGASVQGIIAMLLKDFSKPVIVANIVAWPLAYPIIKGYASIFASRVGISVAPFLWGFAITVVVAWIAVAAQATRAARMNPATVLRSE